MNIVIVTQARLGSSRLPNKVMMKIGHHTMLSLHLQRLTHSKRASMTVVATTDEEGIDLILKECNTNGVNVYQGSLSDVLDRFYQAARKFHANIVVRVTSDCPLIDSSLVDEIIEKLVIEKLDYCSNTLTEDFPDGQDVEVFTFEALERAWLEAKLKSDREHVTPYIKRNSDFNGGSLFKAADLKCFKNMNSIRITVDEQSDLDFIRLLVKNIGEKASWIDYAQFIEKNPDLILNKGILRNAGYTKSLDND